MKERPINCKAHEVLALLDDGNSQMRRVVKPQPTSNEAIGARRIDINGQHQWAWVTGEDEDIIPFEKQFTCPYGQPGDRLWVREKFAIVPRTAYAHSDGVQQTPWPNDPFDHDAAIYAAGWDRCDGEIRWRPSIHMPRWASRILLEVTGVRVERLQDISDTECAREGITPAECTDCDGWVNAYSRLWESINGHGTWDANPWVWVIEFKRVEA